MVHILIADDEPLILDITKTYLEKTSDFTVDTAESAREALEKMQTTTYDAIVSDYQMPEMDGIEFLKTVRGSGSDIPFVIFTGRGREDVVIEALNAGADFYLQKGGQPKAQFAELSHKIRQAVSSKQAKEALIGAHAELDQIFSTAADGMRVVDRDYNVLRVNNTLLDLAGISEDEALGMKCYEAFPGSRCHTDGCPLTRILGGEERVEGEVDKERRDGSRVPCIVTATAFRNPDGEVIGIVEDFKDITELKQAEEDLKKHRKMLDIIEFLPDATFVIDRDGQVIAWNRAMEEMTGVKAEDMIGKGDYEYGVPFYGERRPILIDLVFSGEDELMQKQYSNVQRNGDILIADTTLPRPLGKTEVLMGTASPLYDSSGRVVGAIESIRDITDRKRMEGEIAQSLKEKEVLLKEIHHRVKNNIQVISSLLNLQVKQTTDPSMKEIFREVQNKVKGIALIHEKLYRSENLSEINYGDYLNDISAYILSLPV